MDWVGRLQPRLVVRLMALRGELLRLGPVEVRELPGHHVTVFELRRIGERVEKAAANDLEPLLGARRTPRGLDTPDHVAQAVKRLAAALAADLGVVGLGVR